MTFMNNNVENWSIVAGNEIFGNPQQQTVLFTGNSGSIGQVDGSQRAQFLDGQYSFVDRAYIFDSPGTWTLREDQISAVPVPAALPLMASALGFFGFARRKFNA